MDIPAPDIGRVGPPVVNRVVSPAQLLQSLSPGQTLTAQVTRQLPDGNVELRIGNLHVSSRPPLPLADGQPLLLRVDRVDNQSLELRITNLPDPADIISRTLRESLPRQQPVGETLQRFSRLLLQQLPGREPLPAPLRQAIARLVQSLPDTRQLGQAEGLQRAIRQSGLLLEASLQPGKPAATASTTDLKANLLRVIDSLRQGLGTTATGTTPAANAVANTAANSALGAAATTSAPPDGDAELPATKQLLSRLLSLLAEPAPATTASAGRDAPAARSLPDLLLRLPLLQLLRGHDAPAVQPSQPAQGVAASLRGLVQELIATLEAGVARIQLHQLASLPRDDPDRPLLILDLPVQHEDNIEQLKLTIRRERQQAGAGNEHTWRVTLEFDFAELGTVQARVSIHNRQVNTSFHCNQPGTAELFGTHLEELQQRLTQAGLDAGHLESLFRQAGMPAGAELPLVDGVLDTRA